MWWRRMRNAAWVVVAALAVVVGVGLPIYVFPPVDQVERADLIYVIGPVTNPRLDLAEELRDAGVADRILISVAAEGPESAASFDICTEPAVECAHPEPFTTKGEAGLLSQLAPEADDVVVITFTPHVARTRFVFDRCSEATVTVMAAEHPVSLAAWTYQYLYQTAAFMKSWLTPCTDDSEP